MASWRVLSWRGVRTSSEREAKSREERLEATITDLREQLAHRPESRDEPPVEEPADESSCPTDEGEDRSTSEMTPKTVPSSEETGDNTVPLAQQLQLIEKFSGVNANDSRVVQGLAGTVRGDC